MRNDSWKSTTTQAGPQEKIEGVGVGQLLGNGSPNQIFDYQQIYELMLSVRSMNEMR
jgi:hypothetical protein